MSEFTPNNPNIDRVTGLENRAVFDAHLAYEISHHPGNFMVSFIDFDGLKTTNDRYGHEKGDQLLFDGSQLIQGRLRHQDDPSREPREHDFIGHLYRIGGDELVAILPGIRTEADGRAAMGRIQTECDSVGIGFSVGSVVHEQGMDATKVKSIADTRMYANKMERKYASMNRFQRMLIRGIGGVATIARVDLREAAGVHDAMKHRRKNG